MKVSLVYDSRYKQVWLTMEVAEQTTVGQAIEDSGILERFTDIDLTTQKVGIFGKFTKLDNPLSEGDRIEIYHPLIRNMDEDDDDDDD